MRVGFPPVVVALSALATLNALGVEPPIVSWPGLPKGWTVFCTRLPDSFFLAERDQKRGEYESGISILPGSQRQPRGERLLDAREFLAASGLEFPAGSSAVFNEFTNDFVVIGPREVVDMAEGLTAWRCGPNLQVRIDATLVQFRVDRGTKTRDLPYARLRSVSGASWKELERVVVQTSSGQRALAQQKAGETEKEKTMVKVSTDSDSPSAEAAAPHLGPGQAGTILEVEPIIGPDGSTLSLNYSWTRRVGTSRTAPCLEQVASISLGDNKPAVVAQWPAEAELGVARGSAGTTLALVLQANVVNEEGVPIKQAFLARMKKLREYGLRK